MKTRILVVVMLTVFAFSEVAVGLQAQDEILVAGNPPLTGEMVNQVKSFFEWALDIRLTPAQQRQVKNATIEVWIEKNREEIDSTLSILQVQAKLSQATPAERDSAREKLQPEMLKSLRAEPDNETSRMLVSVYESTHEQAGGGSRIQGGVPEPRATGQSSSSESDVLPVSGNPSLTRQMVDKAARLFEWMLDARLTEEQYQQFQDSLVDSWRRQNRVEIADTLGVVKLYDDLGQKSEAEREAMRQIACNEYLELMRQTPNDVLSQWVLAIYYSAHTPIANGSPPLTRQVADAYSEVLSFMISEVVGGESFKPGKDFKDKLAGSLATQYSSLSPAQQKELSQLPVAWAAIRLTWPQLSEGERRNYRQQWAPGLRAMLSTASATENPAVAISTKATPNARPATGSEARSTLKKFQERMAVHRMLFNMNQDYIHRYVLSPGWSYRKYAW